ncbi:hypothetical protein N0V86_000255 [Didymella sp. IMI 355093]|nr:hypothetical protein N0V86_000255 [Didymella sp. IMI 355093]
MFASQTSTVPDTKDRKGKNNKKKLGIFEPVDLEAGEHLAEPEAPSVAKAVYDKLPDNGESTNASPVISLLPFDHKAFSRFDNVPRPTNNDFGNLVEVQTNDGTFSRVHLNVLRQVPRSKTSIDKNLRRLVDPTFVNRLHCRSDLDLDGVSRTYIHWLYNGNLPAAAIDVSNERQIGDVLLCLAEEYAVGYRICDGRYMNDIMDAFITLQVRIRRLALCFVIELVYENIPEFSMMHLMLADVHAFILVDDAENFGFDLLEDMPKAFIVDVLESAVTLKPNEVNEWYYFLKDTGKTYHV